MAGSNRNQLVPGPQNPDQFAFLSQHGMVRTEEGNRHAEAIKASLIKGMGFFGNDTQVVAIHQYSNSGPSGQARMDRFRTFSRAVEEKCGGDANIKHAWYGATKGEICKILSYGFSRTRQPEEDGYGLGVCLSPVDFPINAALSSLADENGLRHILLCRVILGNMEEICPGSEQSEPSSDHFDSGVDDLSAPTRHIIWSAYMNSHILPRYVVSFRAPTDLRGLETIQRDALVPTPPCTDIPALMSRLSNFLPRSSMVVIENYHAEFQENRISQVQLIGKMRQLGGDNLLSALIKLINRNERL